MKNIGVYIGYVLMIVFGVLALRSVSPDTRIAVFFVGGLLSIVIYHQQKKITNIKEEVSQRNIYLKALEH